MMSGLEYIEDTDQNNVNYTIAKNNKDKKISISILNSKDIKGRSLVTKLKFKMPSEIKEDTTYKIYVSEVEKLSSSQNGDMINYETSDLSLNVKATEKEKQKVSMNTNIIIIVVCILVVIILIVAIVIVIIKAKRK